MHFGQSSEDSCLSAVPPVGCIHWLLGDTLEQMEKEAPAWLSGLQSKTEMGWQALLLCAENSPVCVVVVTGSPSTGDITKCTPS